MGFLLNRWYMAGWSHEVEPGKLLARTIVAKSLVFFRDSDGHARALLDRCPHRFAPLHMGKMLAGGTVQCPYHGLEFDGSGMCTRNPHGDGHIPKNACVPAFATLERHGIIWVWPGDQACVDAGLLPDFSMIDEAHCHTAKRYLQVKANYVLETDNIMDLSHIEFLHPGTLGSDAVKNAKFELVQHGETLHSKRHVTNEQLNPFVATTFGIPAGTLSDRWLDVRWDPPACMLLTVTVARAGAPQESGATVLIPHLFTPETERTTHYWYASCFDRTKHPDGEGKAHRHVEGLTRPFADEDLPMLEAQQKVIGDNDFWSLKPVLLPSDAAAIRARRVLDELLKREAQA